MGLSASSLAAETASGEILREVDGAVEGERAIVVDVDPETLVITDSVQVTDGTGLDEVLQPRLALILNAMV
jgi:hypothetical protein